MDQWNTKKRMRWNIINSIDKEGTETGFDIELLESVEKIKKPLIVSGGCGNLGHIETLKKNLKIYRSH